MKKISELPAGQEITLTDLMLIVQGKDADLSSAKITANDLLQFILKNVKQPEPNAVSIIKLAPNVDLDTVVAPGVYLVQGPNDGKSSAYSLHIPVNANSASVFMLLVSNDYNGQSTSTNTVTQIFMGSFSNLDPFPYVRTKQGDSFGNWDRALSRSKYDTSAFQMINLSQIDLEAQKLSDPSSPPRFYKLDAPGKNASLPESLPTKKESVKLELPNRSNKHQMGTYVGSMMLWDADGRVFSNNDNSNLTGQTPLTDVNWREFVQMTPGGIVLKEPISKVDPDSFDSSDLVKEHNKVVDLLLQLGVIATTGPLLFKPTQVVNNLNNPVIFTGYPGTIVQSGIMMSPPDFSASLATDTPVYDSNGKVQTPDSNGMYKINKSGNKWVDFTGKEVPENTARAKKVSWYPFGLNIPNHVSQGVIPLTVIALNNDGSLPSDINKMVRLGVAVNPSNLDIQFANSNKASGKIGDKVHLVAYARNITTEGNITLGIKENDTEGYLADVTGSGTSNKEGAFSVTRTGISKGIDGVPDGTAYWEFDITLGGTYVDGKGVLNLSLNDAEGNVYSTVYVNIIKPVDDSKVLTTEKSEPLTTESGEELTANN